MTAELQAATADDDRRHRRPKSILLQDGAAQCRRPPLPIMPNSSPSSPQHDGQKQQQQRHDSLSEHGGSNHSKSNSDGAIYPDPRVATAAAAAAAATATATVGAPSAASTSTAAASNSNGVSSHHRLVKRYRVEVAASASSVLSTLTTFPLDSVKTRMQTYRYAGFLDCVRHTYQTEKLRGFFRGIVETRKKNIQGR